MKKFNLLVVCLVLISMFTFVGVANVSAATARVLDDAEVLTSIEEQKLEERLDNIYLDKSVDVVLAIVSNVGQLGHSDVEDLAKDFYSDSDYSSNGMIFVVSLNDREYWTESYGTASQTITYDEKEDLHAAAQSYLSSGDYYDAFCEYIDFVEKELDNVATGEESDTDMSERLKVGGIVFVVSLIIALIVVLMMRSSMKTIKSQRAASSYIVPGSFNLRTERDVYLYTTTRVIRHESNKSSGSGSGSRSGPSGRGGSF